MLCHSPPTASRLLKTSQTLTKRCTQVLHLERAVGGSPEQGELQTVDIAPFVRVNVVVDEPGVLAALIAPQRYGGASRGERSMRDRSTMKKEGGRDEAFLVGSAGGLVAALVLGDDQRHGCYRPQPKSQRGRP